MNKNCWDCQKELKLENHLPLCQQCLKYWLRMLLTGISLLTGLLAFIFWNRFN